MELLPGLPHGQRWADGKFLLPTVTLVKWLSSPHRKHYHNLGKCNLAPVPQFGEQRR